MNAVTLPSTPVSSIDPKPSQLGAELSAQELAIEGGRKTLHGNVSDRVLRMFDAIRAYGSPRVTLDRAVYFTESFKTTEGQPLVLRWAKALKHITENIPVTIFDDELLVGRPNTWLGRYGLVYGELDGSLLKAAVEVCARQKGQKGAVVVTDEDQRAIEEVVHPYWNGKDFGAVLRACAAGGDTLLLLRSGSQQRRSMPPASVSAPPSGGIRRTGPTISPRS